MRNFITRHAKQITGVLHGFDRVLFRGNFLRLCFPEGVEIFLNRQGVLLKHFGSFMEQMTGMMRDAAVRIVTQLHRPPIKYLESSAVRKEEVAKAILREHPVTDGLVCVLSCVEPCTTWQVFRSREHKTQTLQRRRSKCLHYYFYFIDPEFGWTHVRVQTWIPYTVHVYVNGREWLAGQLDREGITYRRADNCFLELGDVARAQEIMDRMRTIPWQAVLRDLAMSANPMLQTVVEHLGAPIHWTVNQSEYATDVMFRKAEDLAALYPRLVRYAISDLHSRDTMRFLGKKLTVQYRGEVLTRFKQRPEGICVRHHAGRNSIKVYDKAGSVLRVETTINDPSEFKRRRRAQGDRDSEVKPRPIRKGVADIGPRAAVGERANARYLDALATVDEDKTVANVLDSVLARAEIGGRKVRSLAPWSHPDLDMLQAIGKGEFMANGFRNRDILPLVTADFGNDPVAKRKASAKVTRLLRILRAHGILRRIPHTHRYQVTSKGRLVLAAVLGTRDASISKLKQCA